MVFFFFNDTATTEIYTLSLHDALPISPPLRRRAQGDPDRLGQGRPGARAQEEPQQDGPVLQGHLWALDWSTGHAVDRKSTRLNSSHANISYAVFCLKKKKIIMMCSCII